MRLSSGPFNVVSVRKQKSESRAALSAVSANLCAGYQLHAAYYQICCVLPSALTSPQSRWVVCHSPRQTVSCRRDDPENVAPYVCPRLARSQPWARFRAGLPARRHWLSRGAARLGPRCRLDNTTAIGCQTAFHRLLRSSDGVARTAVERIAKAQRNLRCWLVLTR